MLKRLPPPNRNTRKMRTAIMIGLLAILVTFGGFGGWAATARIASAIVAPATVTFETQRKLVQHIEGGNVAEIYVRDGDMVRQGDILLKLDEAKARADLAILQGGFDAAVAQEARLIAERDGLDGPEFPDSLLARADDPDVAAVLKGQRTLFRARKESMRGELEILDQRINQLETQIVGLEAQQEAKEKQLVLIKDELSGLKQLFRRGHTTKPRMLALEREVAKLAGERGDLVSEIARTQTKIGETKLRGLQLATERREKVVSELREVQTKIYDFRERISKARHVLDNIEVRAPVSGTIVDMKINAPGEVVRAGETIMEIAPREDRLVVEVKVRPVDIDSLKVGLEADVYLTAYKRRTTPSITGHVIYVSADSLMDDKKQAFYRARIAVSEEDLARIGENAMQPGMPAEVVIKTGSRTPIAYLAQPIVASMNRAWREN